MGEYLGLIVSLSLSLSLSSISLPRVVHRQRLLNRHGPLLFATGPTRQNLRRTLILRRRQPPAAQEPLFEQEENSEISLSRVDNWLEAHKHKDGKVLESAKEKYENVLHAKERNKNKRTFEEFDNDELVEVFWKDKKGRVHAMGSNISRKKLTHLGVAKSKLEQHKKSSHELASLKDEMISLVDTSMDYFEGLMQAILSKITTKSPTVVNSPISYPGSSSMPRSLHLSQNIDTVFATAGLSHSPCSPSAPTRNPQVILCDKYGK